MNKGKVKSKSVGEGGVKFWKTLLQLLVLKGQKTGTWAQRWTVNDWDPGLKDRKSRLPQNDSGTESHMRKRNEECRKGESARGVTIHSGS